MATALHSARTRFFDKCGKPLCGGTVHTYQASTTTAKPTYTDVNKTAVNTNPVILDSIGSAAIFLDGAYRVRVLDRNGVLVEDIAYIESWISATEKDALYTSIEDVSGSLSNHVAKNDNPHGVTKAQVGLGNVDNTADIDKPVSNAVESALLTKADKIDTYTKSETDSKISNLSNTTYAGHKGYATLALAQAAQASLPANTLVEVTNDTTITNNGVYLWNGTTLTKSNNDVLGQAKTYVDSYATVKAKALTASDNLNDIKTQGNYIAYGIGVPSTDRNYPTTRGGHLRVDFVVSGSTGTIAFQTFQTDIGEIYQRYTKTDGSAWLAWQQIVSKTTLDNAISDVNNAISDVNNAISDVNREYDNLIYNQTLDEMLRNPLKSTRIKLIGDSITWGFGSHTSAVEPRTGQLSDPRNTTDASSKTWANLLRQWIAKVYGNGAIIEDKAGSAYTNKNLVAGWRDIYKQVKMTNPQGTVLTDAQKLVVLDTNSYFTETGTSFNFINSTYGETKRPYSMEFDIIGDNLTILYQTQQVGDANDIVAIYVDGTLVDNFNYYAANNYSASKTINFTNGKHTIKLINKSTYNLSYVRIAGFKINKKTWVVNEGIIGSSTKTWLDRNLFEGTLDGADDVILMMLGTNDRGTVGGVDGFRKRLNDCIDRINTLSPKSKVILMSSTFANTDAPTSPYIFDMGVVDKVIASVAKERNLMFISHYKALAQPTIDGEVVLSDGLHLNDLGNKYYYQNIRKKLFDY